MTRASRRSGRRRRSWASSSPSASSSRSRCARFRAAATASMATASLLPRHRGAAPIAHAILAGDASTGVTVMRVEKEMDAGAMALVRETPILADDTTETLTTRLAALTADAIADALDRIAEGTLAWTEQGPRRGHLRAQDRARGTPVWTSAKAPPPWSGRVRAMAPRPGAVTSLAGEPLRILEAAVATDAVDVAPRNRSPRRHGASGGDRRRMARTAEAATRRRQAPRRGRVPAWPRHRGRNRARRRGGRLTARQRRREARGAAGPRRHATPTQARALALRVLERVEAAGAFADLTLRAALGRSDLAPRDRAFVTDLVYGTLRWRGRLDHALSAVSDRPLADLEPGVRTLLRMGAYQILMQTAVPASAAVDQSVRCARSHGLGRAAGFVNAVLRQTRPTRRHPGIPGTRARPGSAT